MSMQWRAVVPSLSLLLIAGCGGGGGGAPPTVTIGGTVTGLIGKLVLQDNAGDDLSVTANGAFTFAIPLNKGATYAVTILTQPPGPTGLFVISSKSLGDPPIQVTTESVDLLGLPARYTLGAQGRASAVAPYSLNEIRPQLAVRD